MRVQETAKSVCDDLQHVTINKPALHGIAKTIIEQMSLVKYSTSTWKSHRLHPQTLNQRTIDWIFVIDLLNFSFWKERSPRKQYTVSFDGIAYTGYWSLCACIQRCLKEGIDIVNPHFYSKSSREELVHALRPDSDEYDEMPLLDDRIRLLHEAGQILVQKYDGSFLNCVLEAQSSCQRLIQIVIDKFGPIFDDSLVRLKDDQIIYFYKRVQILCADIWACFDGQGFGKFDDISTITMFADYRVPQVLDLTNQALLYFDVLHYSKELTDKLQSDQKHHESDKSDIHLNSRFMLPKGHDFEIEIRAASIHSVELLVELIKKELDKGIYNISSDGFNAIILDFYLWDIAKDLKDTMKHLPIHLTRSIYY